ncbi:Type II secretion system protein E [Rhodovastum atsumiense]|uniref:GspE/PulE family protein n=1 Tax=Rhodovastum atsumiense TaxID=504468 RepID=UPI002025668A|nr:GspE/PulE family protein [Rhodovastum atsumiense]CAH2602661.1 Type II secretion system protein E [Rhodovastum atsumiense]
MIAEETLIEAALGAGLIDPDLLPSLRLRARRERVRLLDMVMQSCRLPITALYHALARARQIPFLSDQQIHPDLLLLGRLPANLVRSRLFLPSRPPQGGLVLVLSDPDDEAAREALRRVSEEHFTEAFADPDTLRILLLRGLRRGNEPGAEPAANPVALMEELFQEAWLRRASDIHLEPRREDMQVRLRVDGRLQRFRRPLTTAEGIGLLNRIKALAQLDIAEHRAPQDGSFSFRLGGQASGEFDVRVATVSTRWGERVTMRLLGQQTGEFRLEDLQMPPALLAGFRGMLARPHGLVLITGPTGSGKTTTLYAALRALDHETSNILTVEDPVEQVIDGLTQVEVGAKVSFAQALRSFLRHDPDIILVGEIRDGETADIALKAGLTGHLVLATLHTNDAAAALTRLVDIGCDRHLVAATVVGVVAQRLVRRLCPHCRRRRPATAAEADRLRRPAEGLELHEAVGCPHCLGSGYAGRIGLYGAVSLDAALARQIAGGADEHAIRAASGAMPLAEDARRKVLEGITSLDEVAALAIDP